MTEATRKFLNEHKCSGLVARIVHDGKEVPVEVITIEGADFIRVDRLELAGSFSFHYFFPAEKKKSSFWSFFRYK